MNFIGEVETRWLHHDGADRDMELLSDFAFVDPKGVRWDAPKGWKINGASIPPQLWSVVGSPFVGDYRRASVVHDVHCALQERPHKQVHRMFYDAMICDGVSTLRAKYMYQAVRLFGPKWGPGGKIAPLHLPGYEAQILSRNLNMDIDQLEKYLDDMLGE
jgi:hypothetical protein